MGDDVSVNNANGSSELSKNELVKLLQHGDSNISLIAPEKFKSPIWERFRIVFYKGESRSPARIAVFKATRTTVKVSDP